MREVHLTPPDVVYENEASIDLGGRVVRLDHYSAGHTLGDQVVSIPAQGVVILGDLLESRSFPIMPWFPDLNDTDVDPTHWREILRTVSREKPTVVIPGHGKVGTVKDIDDLAAHMDLVRHEVIRRCDAGDELAKIQKELTPVLVAQHPDWDLKDWIPMEIMVNHTRLCAK
ncbi:MBL fold metallo-hydrolase [Roseateles chitinivorans]|uniref:MBL fold metallo-hydrolase n=1 Tax=Roseateles chitinivorans TaxID=2917965 RepID=UPI003D67E0A3